MTQTRSTYELLDESRAPLPSTRRTTLAQTLKRASFSVPAMVVLAVFHLIAIAFAVYMSFTDWNLGGSQFIGLENYQGLLAGADFLNALLVTAWFVVGTVPATILLALPIAYAISYRLQRTRFYQLVLFLPYVIPTVATGLIWSVMFSSGPGSVANSMMSALGLDAQRWLVDPTGVFQAVATPFGLSLPSGLHGPSIAMVIVCFARIWQMLGFTVVILVSGMVSIDRQVLEAARIDGAGESRILRAIIVPLLSRTLLFVSVISFIFAVREFNTIYVLTGGGPVSTTETLTMLMFRQFYENNQLGLGAATAVLIAVLIVLLTILQFRTGRRSDD